MKNLFVLLLFASFALSSCKKQEPYEGVEYTIKTIVEDDLSYSIKIGNQQTTNYNVVPPAKNASTTFNYGDKKGTIVTLVAKVNDYYPDKPIEVIVSKTNTGEIITSKKSTKEVVLVWTIK